MTKNDQRVLLFYDGFEIKAWDRPLGSILSNIRGQARYLYRSALARQPYTGYGTALMNLASSLRAQGIEVRINDFDAARRDPDHPIGICGFRTVFDRVKIPNPALVFHADFGFPHEVKKVMANTNAKLFALGCDWPCAMYRSCLADAIRPLFVAIDTDKWPDLSAETKTIDYLVYDKVRWDRDELVPKLVNSICHELQRTGRTYHVLRYGHHHLNEYKRALKKSRAMIFICEHETQGIAYQEAMSSNLPVLAWDEGNLVDPRQIPYFPRGQRVSSVPYFDSDCGLTFTRANLFEMLHTFDAKRHEFRPREYVQRELGFEPGAREFMKLYQEVGKTHA